MLSRIVSALSRRLRRTISHLGLSGTKKAITRKSTAGTVSMPNMPRHDWETKIKSKALSPAVAAWATAYSSKAKFTR